MCMNITCIGVPVISAVVKEKERFHKTRLLQFISGVTASEFWSANFTWDQLYLLILGLFSVLAYAYYTPSISNVEETRRSAAIFGSVEILIFSLVMVPVCYVMSSYQNVSSKALVHFLVLVLITGLALTIVVAILSTVRVGPTDMVSETIQWIEYADYVLNIFPPYALGSGLYYIKYRYFTFPLWYEGSNVTDNLYSEAIREDFAKRTVYMLVVGVACLVYVLWKETFKRRNCCGNNKCRSSLGCESREKSPDIDTVDMEEELGRMKQDIKTDVLQVEHLSKGYAGQEFLSVEDLSFGIRKGEIFGFLGSNGAGKSSTLNIITGYGMLIVLLD